MISTNPQTPLKTPLSLLETAYIARYAYIEDRDKARVELSRYLDIKEIRYLYIPKTDTESYIIRHNKNDCIISLAGTGSLKDVKYDLFFAPSIYKYGYVHSGFLKIVLGLREKIYKTIIQMFPEGINHLDIVGHSLGAVLACLLIDEVPRIYRTHEVTGFGCPCGFSKEAQDYLQRHNIHQVINNFDYVTKLLSLTSGRPKTKETYVKGPWGHKMDKYIEGVRKYTRFERINKIKGES